MTNKKFKLSTSIPVGKKPKGISILYTSVMYAVSDNGTTHPTEGWSITVLQMTEKNPYLWTQTIVKYSDGSSTTSYSVSKMGSQGPAGTSVKILGSFSSVADLAKVKNPSIGDGYIINGMLWSYSGAQNNNYGFVEVGKVQGPSGKDAITIIVTPSTIIFDSDEDGTLLSHSSDNDGLGEEKTFQIFVFEGNTDVSKECKYSILECNNFTKYYEQDNYTYVTYDANIGRVYSNGINNNVYTFSDGKTVTKPCSEAWIKIGISYNGMSYIAQVNISVQISAMLSKVAYNNEKLLSEYQKINSNYVSKSTFQQNAEEFNIKVEKQTDQINSLKNDNKTHTNDISELKITANGLTSSVRKTVGDNILRGQNGIGWSSNVEFDSNGPSYKLTKSSEFYTAPAFRNDGKECVLSFEVFGIGNVSVYIFAYDQTYSPLVEYNTAIDKKAYSPDMKILNSLYQYTSADIEKYSASGYVGTWVVSSVDGVSVGDEVAISVFDTSKHAIRHIYASVQEINKTAKTVKTTSIDLLYPAYPIINNMSTSTVYNDTGIGKMHFDEELNRYWIKFKENQNTNNTFQIKFKPAKDGETFIARVMVERDVDGPHKYMDSFTETQSMIKQTSEEIIQRVGNTFVRIGDGNITLNGDTKVNGSLTLNSEDQGFILIGDNGKTEISPKSIGTYSDFKSKTTHTVITSVQNYAVYGTPARSMAGVPVSYNFRWTVTQILGKIKKGANLVFSNLDQRCYTMSGEDAGYIYIIFKIYVNNKWEDTFSYRGNKKAELGTYTVTEDSEIKIIAEMTITKSSSFFNLNSSSNRPTLALSINWHNILPIENMYMLIGYDGFAINLGSGNCIFVGKDEFIVKYGNDEIKATKNGIVTRNKRNVLVVSGYGASDTPNRGEVVEPIDTVLCTARNALVVFPKAPYDGQVLKIFDKCNESCYINSNGKSIVWYNKTDGRSCEKQELSDRTSWEFTYMNGMWYCERTM